MLATTLTSLPSADTPPPLQNGWGDTACAAFLFVGGSWLAHKQLPRLAGQQIEYNAPIFTKTVASTFFAIGIAGGVVGAYILAKQIRNKLNKIKPA